MYILKKSIESIQVDYQHNEGFCGGFSHQFSPAIGGRYVCQASKSFDWLFNVQVRNMWRWVGCKPAGTRGNIGIHSDAPELIAMIVWRVVGMCKPYSEHVTPGLGFCSLHIVVLLVS